MEEDLKELTSKLVLIQAELELLNIELMKTRALLKRAGEAMHITGNQRNRALRFQILNFLKESGNAT